MRGMNQGFNPLVKQNHGFARPMHPGNAGLPSNFPINHPMSQTNPKQVADMNTSARGLSNAAPYNVPNKFSNFMPGPGMAQLPSVNMQRTFSQPQGVNQQLMNAKASERGP